MKTYNPLRKAVWLLCQIYENGKITRAEIERRWYENEKESIPRTSFIRRIREIESLFDIDIECDPQNRYYIANPDKLFSSAHNQLLANISESFFLSRFRKLGAKVQVQSPAVGHKYFFNIGKALEQCLTIKIEYHKFGEDASQEYTLDPLCLKLAFQRWYIVGHKHDESVKGLNIRVFALDRIKKLSITRDVFTKPEGFNADTFFDKFYGIFINTDVEVGTMVVRTGLRESEYLQTLPLHRSQEHISREKAEELVGHHIEPHESLTEYFSYNLAITLPDLTGEALRRGRGFEVLAPEKLRTQVIEEIKKINALYGIEAKESVENK